MLGVADSDACGGLDRALRVEVPYCREILNAIRGTSGGRPRQSCFTIGLKRVGQPRPAAGDAD